MESGEDKSLLSPKERRVLVVYFGSSLFSLALSLYRIILSGGSLKYSYLPWNLMLAWVPLLFGWWFTRTRHVAWQIFSFVLWMIFLPNSFYILSDLIHLQGSSTGRVLFDSVLHISYIFSALLLGYGALLLVHRRILQSFSARLSHAAAAFVLLLSSFAIYLGRYLRWNSWDVLLNPFGLILDVSDRFIDPAAHPRTLSTTMMFFALLGVMYWCVWQLASIVSVAENNQKSGTLRKS